MATNVGGGEASIQNQMDQVISTSLMSKFLFPFPFVYKYILAQFIDLCSPVDVYSFAIVIYSLTVISH